MDIRSWGYSRIMQLPDCVFGQRWLLISSFRVAAETRAFVINSQPMGEDVVLWGLEVYGRFNASTASGFKIALGERVPATEAAFNEMERLFKGDLENVVDEGLVLIGTHGNPIWKCRLPLHVSGRHFVMQYYNAHATDAIVVTFAFEISSMPTEVPDWLVSGSGKNL